MRRGRGKNRLGVIILVVCVLLVGALAAGYMVSTKMIRATYEVEIDSLEKRLDDNTHTVYVTMIDIAAGDRIDENHLIKEEHLVTQATGLFTEEDIGKYALVDIPIGTVMNRTLITESSDENTAREVEYTCLYLSAGLEENDYIDVRIRYQNGEDCVVLPKKQIKKISLASSSCYLVVTENEMQMMASAIIDANEYDAVLYTTKYVKPSVQSPSVITYPPRSELLPYLFSSDGSGEEWMRKRGELEERLENGGRVASRAQDISNYSKPQEGGLQSNVNGTGMSSDPGVDIVE